jgi:hypothetical protein
MMANEEADLAAENFATMLGRRPQRELIAAAIFAGTIVRHIDNAKKKGISGDEAAKDCVTVSVSWADIIIKYCKDNPPKT